MTDIYPRRRFLTRSQVAPLPRQALELGVAARDDAAYRFGLAERRVGLRDEAHVQRDADHPRRRRRRRDVVQPREEVAWRG